MDESDKSEEDEPSMPNRPTLSEVNKVFDDLEAEEDKT